MAELERRRAEREEKERLHAEELRLLHLARIQQEETERQKIVSEIEKQKAKEREMEERRKVCNLYFGVLIKLVCCI